MSNLKRNGRILALLVIMGILFGTPGMTALAGTMGVGAAAGPAPCRRAARTAAATGWPSRTAQAARPARRPPPGSPDRQRWNPGAAQGTAWNRCAGYSSSTPPNVMDTDVSRAICVSVSRWKTGVASSTRLAPALRIRAISSSGLMSRPGFDRCQRRYPSTAASTAFVIDF